MIKLLSEIKNIDDSIMKIMKIGFKFSIILGLLFTYVLFFYAINPTSHVTFEIGYLGVKCSLMFFVCFLVGALASNRIKNGEI